MNEDYYFVEMVINSEAQKDKTYFLTEKDGQSEQVKNAYLYTKDKAEEKIKVLKFRYGDDFFTRIEPRLVDKDFAEKWVIKNVIGGF
jgi:hypothetical protein